MRLGGRQYAKRYRTAQGRAGAGQQGEDGDSGAGAGGHVGDGHEALALGELDDQLAPAAEGNEGKHGARVARAGEGCVPAAQSRRMLEQALGLLLTSGGGGWASAPRQHMRPVAHTFEACGRRGGERVYLWH